GCPAGAVEGAGRAAPERDVGGGHRVAGPASGDYVVGWRVGAGVVVLGRVSGCVAVGVGDLGQRSAEARGDPRRGLVAQDCSDGWGAERVVRQRVAAATSSSVGDAAGCWGRT